MKEEISRVSPEIRIRQKALRKACYRCEVCQGINNKEGYYNESGIFIMVDEHMRDWAVRQGIKLKRIHLQVLTPNLDKDVVKAKKLLVRCQKHAMQYKNKVRDYLKYESLKTGE